MNTFQARLWHDLMRLAGESEAFYFADHKKEGDDWFRIFNYRLASYKDFMRPNGTECRGHTFRVTEEGYAAKPISLVSLPMEKFWNLYECPATIDLDLSTVTNVWHKMDGSLISTYVDSNGSLHLKSKASLSSDQAMAAMGWMSANREFCSIADSWARKGFTVNMEWCAPDNRIVISYEDAGLRVLNIRNNATGEYVDQLKVEDSFGEFAVDEVGVDQPHVRMEEFIASIPDMQAIEGFVVRLESGQRVKIKTLWYLAMHRIKDKLNSPRRLFEAVLEEATDDMRTLYHGDPLAIKAIQEMEEFVAEKYNHMVDTVERFYERNKYLERKEYAMLGQKEMAEKLFFALSMKRFNGGEINYKDVLKSRWRQLGLMEVEKNDD